MMVNAEMSINLEIPGRGRRAGRAWTSPARTAALALAIPALLGTISGCATLASASPAVTTSHRTAQNEAQRPNILFILIDDMGFADLSIMGNRKVETPHLDRLAREGVLLTSFYDASPICSSSRAAFLTGRFPAEIGFVGITATREKNAALGQADWLDPKLPTIARMLRDAGYATAHIGKWHLGGGRDIGDAPWPTAYGFDQSFTTFEGLGPRVLVSDSENKLSEQSAQLGAGPFFWEKKTNLTRLYGDMTVDFVARHSREPWFVNLWLNDLHDPWTPDEDSANASKGRGDDADDDRFLATLVKMDRTLGELFERLEQMGEFDNTLIIVTSDNGPPSLQRYYKDGATPPGSVRNLRGRKFSIYEGGIRQPLILSWPAGAKAGHRDDRTVGQGVDLLPTLASLAGVTPPADLDGIDLSPALTGHPVTSRPPLFWAYGKEGAPSQPAQPSDPRDVSPRFAIRDGNWKLLAHAGGAGAQLYDLGSDPGESHDLAAARPDVRDGLLAKLKAWMATLPE